MESFVAFCSKSSEDTSDAPFSPPFMSVWYTEPTIS
jgi:hypothetical protein